MFCGVLFWSLSQAVPARESVCIPVVLLNQTGLQHSVLFLDSGLPFLSCKKYSSVSGWQAISFYKCVRPRFLHLSLSPSPFMSWCTLFFFRGGKGEGLRVLIHALDFSIHRSLASPGSFIFCTWLLTQLCSLSVMGEVLRCTEPKARAGGSRASASLISLVSPSLSAPQTTLGWLQWCNWEMSPTCT